MENSLNIFLFSFFLYSAILNNATYTPAMHAVKKHATFPQIIERRDIAAKSDFFEGASAPTAPRVIPMEPKLAKPHSAYVAITSDLT